MRGVRQYEGGEELRHVAGAAPLVVGEAHDLALLFGNQLVAPGEAQKQFGAALVREAGKDRAGERDLAVARSEEHTSELQSLMRISYAVFCLKKTKDHICCKYTQRNKSTKT